jgi:hypothetical protein
MTKDELIALSDLNREDNIKYISSEAQGIAITLDSDRYAPTLCKLERAYICGRRKSEEQIEQLEKENAELKEQNETKDIQIKELQEQKCYWKESSFDWRHKFFKKDEVKRLVKKDKQLTKAKNLLQKVADVCGYPNYDIPVELYADIADFLKESEEGK